MVFSVRRRRQHIDEGLPRATQHRCVLGMARQEDARQEAWTNRANFSRNSRVPTRRKIRSAKRQECRSKIAPTPRCSPTNDIVEYSRVTNTGQRLTAGWASNICSRRFMVQPLPPKFCRLTVQSARPRGRSGAARRASPLIPGEGRGEDGLVTPSTALPALSAHASPCPSLPDQAGRI